MSFKFEKLDVWKLALDYVDEIYELAARLPKSEDYNLRSQITRAATSVGLNIAEGSTGQTDAEQARFLGLAIRSLIETIACQRIIERRKLLENPALAQQSLQTAETLFSKLQAFRKAIAPNQNWLHEGQESYLANADNLVLE